WEDKPTQQVEVSPMSVLRGCPKFLNAAIIAEPQALIQESPSFFLDDEFPMVDLAEACVFTVTADKAKSWFKDCGYGDSKRNAHTSHFARLASITCNTLILVLLLMSTCFLVSVLPRLAILILYVKSRVSSEGNGLEGAVHFLF
ncbi:hypothetical protein PAXRUDRAFT_162889, partial [Paxillus rubicundulus Ve08.2h10]